MVDQDALPAAGQDGKDAALVQAMFDRVARRYDLANAVLSMGQDRHWRRVTAQAAEPAGAVVLDIASGPGEVAMELLRHGAARVIAADLSFGMLAEGVRRTPDAQRLGLSFVNADATRLPVADDSVDAITISFGLRNVVEPQRALAEFARVAKPGARLVVSEVAAPTWGPFRALYLEYLMKALPRVAQVVSSDPRAYVYLAESIRAWPDRLTIAGWMQDAGWADVQVKNLAGGIVAVHRGRLPS
jgi:demethylmenaquinone methyltransferase/2-methoxy-6-polyprenyl-1,4-benzoquinol methylase